MRLTDREFRAILEDETKSIVDDIAWSEDEDHSPAWEFRIDVESASGWPLFIKGRYNSVAGTLSYALILKTEGRIYGLISARTTIIRNVNTSGRSTNIAGRSATEISAPTCRMT